MCLVHLNTRNTLQQRVHCASITNRAFSFLKELVSSVFCSIILMSKAFRSCTPPLLSLSAVFEEIWHIRSFVGGHLSDCTSLRGGLATLEVFSVFLSFFLSDNLEIVYFSPSSSLKLFGGSVWFSSLKESTKISVCSARYKVFHYNKLS